ncbi:MAG: nitroreductase family protein [Eggerthellaceae bacterium]|nr:nitroreductase family protein [Eggerthellaceae bacterium]
MACAIENMTLCATSLGLGSVYLWGFLKKLRKHPEVVAELGLPEGYTVLSALAVGPAPKPVAPHKPKGRIEVDYLL